MLLFAFAAVVAALAGDRPFDHIPDHWPERLTAPVPKDAANPCAGLRINYFERIEAQGFLGLATPSARAQAVERAVFYNILVGWKRQEMLDKLDRKEPWNAQRDYTEAVPQELRPSGDTMGLLAFHFDMYEMCVIARSKGIKSITFACVSDTSSDTYESASRPGTSETHEWLDSSCFLSTFEGNDPSLKDLRRHRWGEEISSHDYGRSIGDQRTRELAYFPLVRRAVGGVVAKQKDEDNQKRRLKATAPATGPAASCVTQPELPGAPAARALSPVINAINI